MLIKVLYVYCFIFICSVLMYIRIHFYLIHELLDFYDNIIKRYRDAINLKLFWW